MMEIETTIIGAGVIGLAVAAKISEQYKDIFLLERNARFGEEISSRNSEVIHAGIYYPKDSFKARLCVEGNQRLYRLCESHRIPHCRCGKVIIATERDEVGQLEKIMEKARANGVEEVQSLTRKDLQRLLPKVRAVAGIYSPSTGIIDSRRLMRHFVAKAGKNGVNFVYQAKVERIVKAGENRYEIHVVYPDGARFSYHTQYVINCAGLEADTISESMGIDVDAFGYRQYYWKGEYFSLNVAAGYLDKLVYPIPQPDNVGLGIHTTIDLSGRIRLGPNAKYLGSRIYNFTVDPEAQKAFFKAAKRYLPDITYEDLSPDTAGIRPKLQRPGDSVQDFIISEESEKELPGVINLIGIESPGLTSCLAIAQYVYNLLRA